MFLFFGQWGGVQQQPFYQSVLLMSRTFAVMFRRRCLAANLASSLDELVCCWVCLWEYRFTAEIRDRFQNTYYLRVGGISADFEIMCVRVKIICARI